MYDELKSCLEEFGKNPKSEKFLLHYDLDKGSDRYYRDEEGNWVKSKWSPRPFFRYLFEKKLIISEDEAKEELKEKYGKNYVVISVEALNDILRPEGLMEKADIDDKRFYFPKANYRWEDLAGDIMIITEKIIDGNDVIKRADELRIFEKKQRKKIKDLANMMFMGEKSFLKEFTMERIEKILKEAEES